MDPLCHVWPALYAGVASIIDRDGVRAAVKFGKREVFKQPKTPTEIRARITFVPGDDTGSNVMGSLVPTASSTVDHLGRPLGTVGETFTIYLDAAAEPSSEHAAHSDLYNYAACRTLLEQFWRAFYEASYTMPRAKVGGRWEVKTLKWMRDKTFNPKGECLQVLITIPVHLPDSVDTIGFVIPAEAELIGILSRIVDGAEVEGDSETTKTEEFP